MHPLKKIEFLMVRRMNGENVPVDVCKQEQPREDCIRSKRQPRLPSVK
jgi:hypothetical protein